MILFFFNHAVLFFSPLYRCNMDLVCKAFYFIFLLTFLFSINKLKFIDSIKAKSSEHVI